MRARFAFVIAGVALAGCSRESTATAPESSASQPDEPPAAQSSSTVVPARPGDPTPDPITHPCVVAAARYDQAIARGSTDCTADADCGCYQGGIGKKSGCGGVLNAKSVKELDDIAREFHDMKCKISRHCAAWACQPSCEAGHCVR